MLTLSIARIQYSQGWDSQLHAQYSARQQSLHIAPAIRNEIDEHLLPHHPIDEPVGLEVRLAIFAYPELEQFFWIGAALRENGQGCGNIRKFIQHVIRITLRIILGNVTVDIFKVALRTAGEQYLVAHFAAVFPARMRRTASARS